MIQTKRAGTPMHTELWYCGTNASSKSGVVFTVESFRGRTIEPEVDRPVDFETSWAEVIAASAKTSLSFLEDEPDLYED